MLFFFLVASRDPIFSFFPTQRTSFQPPSLFSLPFKSPLPFLALFDPPVGRQESLFSRSVCQNVFCFPWRVETTPVPPLRFLLRFSQRPSARTTPGRLFLVGTESGPPTPPPFFLRSPLAPPFLVVDRRRRPISLLTPPVLPPLFFLPSRFTRDMRPLLDLCRQPHVYHDSCGTANDVPLSPRRRTSPEFSFNRSSCSHRPP